MSTIAVAGVAAVVVLEVVVACAIVVVVRVVAVGVDVPVVIVKVEVLLHDAATKAKAIKPVLSSIRQWILFGNRFFNCSPFLCRILE